MDQTEEHETQRVRRERVRRLLIDPLVARGLRKRKGVSAEDHALFLERVERRLAYLPEHHLATLVEVLERNADGANRTCWPGEASIVAWAAGLMPPPDANSRLVRSFLASAAGLRAWEEDPAVAVALWVYLRQFGRPPLEGDWPGLRVQAREWLGKRARAVEARDAGRIGAEQAGWLEASDALLDRVRGLVFAKAENAA